MIKLNKNGLAVEVYEYDQDHKEIQRPVYNVSDFSNVELLHESMAKNPAIKVKRIKSYNPKEAYMKHLKNQFAQNVYKEQNFSGTNYEMLEEALNQSYEFNPNYAHLGPISDYPQIVDVKRNMNFNGPMGSWLSDWLGINVDLREEVEKKSPQELVQASKEILQTTGVIPRPSSSGGGGNLYPAIEPVVRGGSSVTPAVLSPTYPFSFNLTPNQKKIVMYLAGLSAVLFLILLIKSLIPKRST